MADVRTLAADALLAVEEEAVYAKEAIERVREEVSDPRDRALLTEIVYGVTRRRGTLDAVLATASKVALPRLDPAVRVALRTGLYQLLFLERIPAHAAVNAAVGFAKERTNPRFAGFVNGTLRGIQRGVLGPAVDAEDPRRDVPRPGSTPLRFRRAVFPDPVADPAGNAAARFSHPAWLVTRWLARYPAPLVRSILEVGISRPPLSLRAPPGRREALLAELAVLGVGARVGAGRDEVLVGDGDPAALAPVREGLAFVQDGTAQRVAPLLDPQAGDRLLDLCAAPGGKTLHLLDLLGERGEVVACDASAEKVASLTETLSPRAARADGPRVRVVAVPETGALPFAPSSFHGVLVDAPCSNTGVLRRRPEVRDRLRAKDVASLAAAQRALLERVLPLVRPGGRLVYSTCSIEPEENAGVIDALRAAHPSLEPVDGFEALPTPDADGGFAAALRVPG